MKPWKILLILAAIFGATMATIKISSSGVNKIKRYEQLKLKPYKDVGGKWTIGWGHLIKPDEDYLMHPGGITEAKAEQLIQQDLAYTESAINSYVKVPINGNQYDALVSFVFNIGITAFKESTLLNLINQGKYSDAALQFGRWKYAGGEIVQGLINRRIEEQQTFIA